ncbi:MAG: hypothetical protein KDE22_06990, partial [Rhodobacterales bacterium]|nr:hypothetical protein [Rhodobacterales bacterium]
RATIDRAAQTARAVSLTYARAFALNRVAQAQIDLARESGDAAAAALALDLAREVRDKRLRAVTLWTLARDIADPDVAARARADAEAAAGDLPPGLSRVWVLTDQAEHLLATGRAEPAEDRFRDALDRADAITDAWGRSRAMVRLAALRLNLDRTAR